MSVHVPCWVWPPRYDIKGWRIHPGQVSYGPRNNYDAAVVSIVAGWKELSDAYWNEYHRGFHNDRRGQAWAALGRAIRLLLPFLSDKVAEKALDRIIRSLLAAHGPGGDGIGFRDEEGVIFEGDEEMTPESCRAETFSCLDETF